MEGEGGKKGVRRPMNAFLIFCKCHRSKVREKNPEMDNRSITRVLGDLWAKLGGEEKASFTNLAKQYKDAFMKANPDYKWHASDKVHSGATSKNGSTKAVNTSSSKSMQEIPMNMEITPGKLADPGQMGGLNLLLMAGKESNLMHQKSKMSSPSLPSSISSSLFSNSSTHISVPPSKPLADVAGKTLPSVPSPSQPLFLPDAMMSSHPAWQRSPFSADMSEQEANSANSALLQLAEMCTTELYSSDSRKTTSPGKATAAPPKKRAKHWNSPTHSSLPLHEENGRRPNHHMSSLDIKVECPNQERDISDYHNVPLDLSHSQQSNRGRRKQRAHEDKQSVQRKRKRSSSATDSVSSQPPSPVGAGDVFFETDTSVKISVPESSHLESKYAHFSNYQENTVAPQNGSVVSGFEKTPPRSDIVSSVNISLDNLGSYSGEGKVASLLKGDLPIAEQQCKGQPLPSELDKKVVNLCTSTTVTTVTPSSATTTTQPFTQGKLKKKWTQRMMVEAKQEEELSSEKKLLHQQGEMQAHFDSKLDQKFGFGAAEPMGSVKMEDISSPEMKETLTKLKAEPHSGVIAQDCLNIRRDHALSVPVKQENYKDVQQTCLVRELRNPLPPPPPIMTSFAISEHNTLYKALTSEISPPRQCGPRLPAITQDPKMLKPIAACGKKIVDHIVEKLIRTDFSKDKKESQSEARVGQPVLGYGYSVEDQRRIWPMTQSSMVGNLKTEQQVERGTDQLHHISFPASSLVEKVARQICCPHPVNDGVNEDNGFVRHVYNENNVTSQCFAQPDGGRRRIQTEKPLDMPKSTKDAPVEAMDYSHDVATDDQNSIPVRKSRRANRGQKYQALIKEGIIQPSKERLAARNCAKVIRSFSAREDSDQPESGVRSFLDRESARPVITRELSEPGRKVVAGEFDLEREMASLPVCSLAQMERKRPRLGRESPNVAAYKDKEALAKFGDTTSQCRLGASESRCSRENVPLAKDETPAMSLTGSRKRKARRHRITRISVMPDNSMKDKANQSRRLANLTPPLKDLLHSKVKIKCFSSSPSKTREDSDTAKANLTSTSADENVMGSSHIAHDNLNVNSTALNLLTSAAIESEKAAFPCWSLCAQLNSSVTSQGERPEQQVVKSSPLPTTIVTTALAQESTDATTIPTSIPEEAHVNNVHPEASKLLSIPQRMNPCCTTLTSTSSSSFLPPNKNLNNPLLASVASVKLDVQSNQRPVNNGNVNMKSPSSSSSSSFIPSTLPTSNFLMHRSESKPGMVVIPNPPVLRRNLPLKVPIISSGDGPNAINELSRQVTDLDRRLAKDEGDKKALFQHSQKLVKLLLNKDVPLPNLTAADSVAGKPSEVMPTIHFAGEPPAHPLQNKKRQGAKDRRKQVSNVNKSPNFVSSQSKGFPSLGKLFSAAQTGVNDSSVKKHKPTIWDHLSSQCPIPMKAVKNKTPPFVPNRQPQRPLVQQHAPMSRGQQNFLKKDQGSDTDSANEGAGDRTGASDTDSADEGVGPLNAISMSHQPVTNVSSSSCVLSTSLQKSLPVVEINPKFLPPVAKVCSGESTPSTHPCDKTHVVRADPLPPSFVAVSSITLPSDIPEADLLSSIKPSSTSHPSPQSPKFIVKAIPPTSSFPGPHVTDLSSASSAPPINSTKVTPATSCILLSTLTTPPTHTLPTVVPSSHYAHATSATTTTTSKTMDTTTTTGDGNRHYNYSNVAPAPHIEAEPSHPCTSPRLPGSPSLAVVQS